MKLIIITTCWLFIHYNSKVDPWKCSQYSSHLNCAVFSAEIVSRKCTKIDRWMVSAQTSSESLRHSSKFKPPSWVSKIEAIGKEGRAGKEKRKGNGRGKLQEKEQKKGDQLLPVQLRERENVYLPLANTSITYSIICLYAVVGCQKGQSPSKLATHCSKQHSSTQ